MSTDCLQNTIAAVILLAMLKTDIQVPENSTVSVGSSLKVFRWSIFALTLCFFSPIFWYAAPGDLPFYYTNGFFLAIGITLVACFLAGIMHLWSKKTLTLTRLDLAAAAFALYFLVRFVFTPYAHWMQGRFIWWIALMVMYMVFRILYSSPGRQRPAISAILLIALGQIVVGQLQLLDILPVPNPAFQISGTFFNPAPYSCFLAVIFPFALFELVNPKSGNMLQKALAWMVAAGVLLVIIPAQSRAAWLALLTGSLWVLSFRFSLVTSMRKLPRVRLILMAAVVFIAAMVSGYTLYQLKASSASGRLLIWKVSVGMWADKPIFGKGALRFASDYMPAQADYFASGHGTPAEELLAGNIPFAYNEFLQIAVELGVLGLILILMILGIALVSRSSHIHSARDSLHTSFQAAMVAWLVLACFSYPLAVWGTALLPVFLLAGLSAHQKEFAILTQLNGPISGIATVALFFSAVLLSLWIARSLPAVKQWTDGLAAYSSGKYEAARMEYAKAFDELQYEGVYLQQAGKCLSQLGHYEASNSLLLLARNYYSDPILYTTLGNNLTYLKAFDKAEAAFTTASNMMPSRIHPAYLQAQMYYTSGQREKAAHLAGVLLKQKIKVHSQATDEMLLELKVLRAISF